MVLASQSLFLDDTPFLLGCRLLMTPWSDSLPFPSLSVLPTVPFFGSLRWSEPCTWSCIAWLFSFPRTGYMALWPRSWGTRELGLCGENDLVLITVLSLFSACHLRCWRRVHGEELVPPHSASLWVSFDVDGCADPEWGPMHGFLGVAFSFTLIPYILGGPLSEGQLCLAAAWAFDDFSWISPLFPKSPVPAQISMPLDKEPWELQWVYSAPSRGHREL